MGPKIKDYIFSFASIFINVCSNIVMVPLYVNYFGVLDYGVWIVINTILQYLMLANFGIPTALTTIATNASRNESVSEIFWKSFRIMILIVSVLTLIISLLFLTNSIPYDFFFGQSQKTQFYASILFLTITLYLIRSPFQLSSAIFLISGRVSLNKQYEIANNLIIPVSFFISYLCKGNIFFYAICWSSLLLVSSVVMYFHARLYLLDYYNADLTHKDKSIGYRQIIKTSVGYFIVSMGALLVWNTDNFVIVNFLGVNSVTSYSLTFRIFTACFSVLLTINAVLLPFYGKYNSTKDYHAIQMQFKTSMLLMTLISGPLCITVYLFSKEIFLTWTKNPSLYLGSNIFLAFGLYTFVLSCMNSISTLLSALKKIKLLIFATFAEGIINLLLSLLFIRKFGIIGVSLGTLSGSLLSFIILCIFFKRHIEIPVKIPFFVIIRNLSLIIVTVCVILLADLTVATLAKKVLSLSGFAVVFALINFKDIVPLLKLRK